MRSILQKVFLVVTICCCFYSKGFSQSFSGKDFWIGFMQNVFATTDVDGNTLNQNPTYQVQIASDSANSGTVSVPLKGWSQNFTVAANSVVTITVPFDKADNSGGPANSSGNYPGQSDVVAPTGVHITTTKPAVVYANNNQYATSDAATALPTNALLTSYHIIAFGTQATGTSEFIIVGTQDNTTVTLNLSSWSNGHHTSLANYSITLNKGETYQVQSYNGFHGGTGGTALDYDLTGSTVESDKPVALFGGNICPFVGGCDACDHLYEQIRPIGEWSTTHLAVPTKKRNTNPPVADVMRVYAQDSTNYTFLGVTFPLSARSYRDHELLNPGVITSDNPLNISQYIKGADCSLQAVDPLALDVIPTEQFGSSYIFATSSYSRFDFHNSTIIIPTTKISTLRINGAPLPITQTFTAITGTSFSYTYLALSGNTQYKILTTDGTGFGLYVYGYGVYESYGYTGGGLLQNFCDIITQDVTICSGQTATLSAASPYAGVGQTYQWFKNATGGLPLGSGPTFTTPVLTATDSFYVEVNKKVCSNQRVKIMVYVNPTPTSTFSANTSICKGDELTISYTGTAPNTATYTWSFDGGTIVSGTGKGPYTVKWNTAGTKNVTLSVTQNNCSSTLTTKTITVNDVPVLSPTIINSKCAGENDGSVNIDVTGGTSPFQYSKDNITFSSSNTFNNLAKGNYVFYVKDSKGCSASISATITEPKPILISGSSNPATCGTKNGSISVNASQGTGPSYEYRIDTPGSVFQSNGTFNDLGAGLYNLTVKDMNGCTKDTSISISNLNGPTLSLQSDITVEPCYGDSAATITATASGSSGPFSYSIDGSAKTSNNVFTKIPAGTHNIEVYDNTTSCIAFKSITITQPPQILVDSIRFNDAYCDEANGNIHIYASGGTGALSYSLNGGSPQNDGNFTNLDKGNYSISISDLNSCSITSQATLKNLGKPKAVIVHPADTTICNNGQQSVSLIATGGLTYLWSPATNLNDPTSATPFATPNTTTTYKVVVTDSKGCQDSASVTINVNNPLPKPVVVCGTSTTTSVTFNWSAISGALGYEVSINSGPWIPPSSGATGTSHKVTGLSPNQNVNILVHAVGSAPCGNSADATATCKSLNCTLAITTLTADKNLICPGEAVQLNSSTNENSVTYSWSPTDNLSNANIPNPTVTPSKTTTYELTVNDGACTAKKSITIKVKPLPKAIPSYKKSGVAVEFDADTSNEIDSWTWDYGDRSPLGSGSHVSHSYLQKDVFTVTLIVTNSCGSDTIMFDINVDGSNDSVPPMGINKELLKEAGIAVFPNPFQNQLNIQLKTEKPSFVNIGVYDLLGRQVDVILKDEIIISGDHIFTISNDRLQGMNKLFFVIVQIDGKRYVQKVVKE